MPVMRLGPIGTIPVRLGETETIVVDGKDVEVQKKIKPAVGDGITEKAWGEALDKLKEDEGAK